MPAYVVVEDLGGGRQLVEVTEGDLRGQTVVLTSTPSSRLRSLEALASDPLGVDAGFWDRIGPNWRGPDGRGPRPPRDPRVAGRRARSLLRSVLDERQRADYDLTGHFDVPTPYGVVRLGTLYHLGFTRSDGRRFRCCVVPRGMHGLPIDDIWVNLTLVLRADPDQFFAVANWHDVDPVHGGRPVRLGREQQRRSRR